MARTTLPDIDPLDQLGIGQRRHIATPPDPVPERSAAEPRPALTIAPTPPPAALETPAEDETGQGAAADAAPAPRAPVAKRSISPKGQGAGRAEKPNGSAEPATVHPLKVKFNARIPAALSEEVRNCVVALYSSHQLTIDDLTASALKRELDRLKKAHNSGQDFPARSYGPKVGRPVR